MSIESDLSELKSEFAALRKRFEAISKFVTIETDDAGEPVGMNLRCGIITFYHLDVPNHIQSMIGASANGPYIYFYDFRGKGRVSLAFDKHEPSLVIRGPDMLDGVMLTVDQAGRGMAAVFDKGRPRALMKAATGNAGTISAVHDDGESRIFLRSTGTGGEFMAVASGIQASVKITSDTVDGGGLVHVTGASGTPGIVLATSHLGGCVLVNDAEGKPIAILPGSGGRLPGA